MSINKCKDTVKNPQVSDCVCIEHGLCVDAIYVSLYSLLVSLIFVKAVSSIALNDGTDTPTRMSKDIFDSLVKVPFVEYVLI